MASNSDNRCYHYNIGTAEDWEACVDDDVSSLLIEDGYIHWTFAPVSGKYVDKGSGVPYNKRPPKRFVDYSEPVPEPDVPPVVRTVPNLQETLSRAVWGSVGKTKYFDQIDEITDVRLTDTTISCAIRLYPSYRRLVNGEKFIWITVRDCKVDEFVDAINNLEIVPTC